MKDLKMIIAKMMIDNRKSIIEWLSTMSFVKIVVPNSNVRIAIFSNRTGLYKTS
jgi:hypothetical protein